MKSLRELEIKRVKSTMPVSQLPRKRKVASPIPLPPLDYDEDDEVAAAAAQARLAGLDDKHARKKKVKGEQPEEKRLKRFRQKAPQAYLERLERVKTQRMFLIDRKREGDEEVFDLAGSTGNIYQVTLGKVPRCTCPDNGKGNQCKHIVYVSWLLNIQGGMFTWVRSWSMF